jgi:hypothetical protein
MNPMALEMQLPTLSDQAITQMMQTTQQDATVWPLVATEMRRRQELRSRSKNQQALAAQQQGQQPTVREMTEQQIASSGLAQLAPNDVATMAGGGLASLMQDYEETPGYNGETGSLVGAITPYNFEQRLQQEDLEMLRGQRRAYSPDLQAYMDAASRSRAEGEQAFAERERQRMLGRMPTSAAAMAANPDIAAFMAPRAAPTAPTAPTARATTAALAARPRVAPPAPAPAAPPAPAYAAPSVDELGKRVQTMQTGLGTPFAEEYRDLQRQQTGDAAQALLDAQGLGRLRDELISRREQRIGKEEAGLSKERDRELGLALLQAGGTLAQTPGAFGVGAGRALKEFGTVYGAGLEKLKLAQNRINEARDRLDEARLGGASEQAKARAEYSKAVTAAQGMRLNALREDFNINRKAAADIVTTQARLEQGGAELTSRERMAAAELTSRERIASLQAAASKALAEGRRDLALENTILKTYQRLQDEWKQDSMRIISTSKNIKTFDDYLRAQGFDKSLLPGLQAAGIGGGSGLTFKGTEPAPKP